MCEGESFFFAFLSVFFFDFIYFVYQNTDLITFMTSPFIDEVFLQLAEVEILTSLPHRSNSNSTQTRNRIVSVETNMITWEANKPTT